MKKLDINDLVISKTEREHLFEKFKKMKKKDIMKLRVALMLVLPTLTGFSSEDNISEISHCTFESLGDLSKNPKASS